MKRSKLKVTNPSMSVKKVTKSRVTINNKKVHYLEEYRSLFDWKFHPLTERFLEQFSADIIKWAHEDKKNIRVEDFLSLKGVPRSTYEGWIKKYPQIAEANDEVTWRVSLNREQLGLENKLNPGFVERTMPIYNQRYREFLEWRLAKQASSGIATGNIQVIIPPIEDSKIVPPKKDDQ